MKRLIESIFSVGNISDQMDSAALTKLKTGVYEEIVLKEFGVLYNSLGLKGSHGPEKQITVKEGKVRQNAYYSYVSKPYKNFYLVEIGAGGDMYWVCTMSKRSQTTFDAVCVIGQDKDWSSNIPYYRVDPNKIKQFLDGLHY